MSRWLAEKTWDTTAPLGPVLMTADEVEGAAGLVISWSVNGIENQRDRTSELLFGRVDLVAYVSTFTRLQPGDVLLTGTPGGVGTAREPQEFLRPRAVVETTLEGIGTCRNLCVGA